MKRGDRVFVDGVGAGHVVGFKLDPGEARPRLPAVTWVIVELDTGRRRFVHPSRVKPTDEAAA